MPPSADRSPARRALRVALALAALGSAALLASRGGLSVASPERQVREALARLVSLEGLEAGAARVDVADLVLRDVNVSVEGDRAVVLAVADAEGTARFDGQAPRVSYVGRERFAVERCPSARWCPAPDALEGLRGVVAALARAPRPEGARVRAWQIRVERDSASVGEDYEAGDGAGARRLRARRELVREGAGWALVP